MCVAWRGHRMLHGILSFFFSTSETVLFLLSRCHRGADGLINRSLDVWQRFVFWFCCHAVVTRATCMFPVCYNGSVTTWRRDGTKTKQRRRMYPLRFGCPYHQLRYNKGVGWQNKAISWQPYSVSWRPYCIYADNRKGSLPKVSFIFPLQEAHSPRKSYQKLPQKFANDSSIYRLNTSENICPSLP